MPLTSATSVFNEDLNIIALYTLAPFQLPFLSWNTMRLEPWGRAHR